MSRTSELMKHPVTRVRVESLGITLDPPEGWHVREGATFAALVRDAEREVPGEELAGTLWIEPGRDADLDTAAALAMRRYVRQGMPEYARVVVQGRTAHRYSWTDGVRSIVTWFVEVGPRVVAIHVDADAFRERPDAELERAALLLPCVSLDPPLHDHARRSVWIPHPREHRAVDLSGGRIEAVRRYGRVVQVDLRSERDGEVALRFAGVESVIDRKPAAVRHLAQIDGEPSRDLASDESARLITFAFEGPGQGESGLEIACEPTELELTAIVVAAKAEPILKEPDAGQQLCPSCDGQRVCSLCKGGGRVRGERCRHCLGRGSCIGCDGAGQISASVTF